jgi:hypothetical protein
VIQHQYFNGYKFTKDKKTGYYLSSKKINGSRKRLHVYVWEYHNGSVPKGCHVHHKDTDKDNNKIENLILITNKKHSELHAKLNVLNNHDKIVENLANKALPKAVEWHKSDEGREWHKEQYERVKDKFHANKIYECLNCGKSFTTQIGNNKFCSNSCKSSWRRKSGVDNEERICICCGQTFTTNKYSKAKTCSRKCTAVYRHKNSKN